MTLPFALGFFRLEVPEQALDGIPLGLELVVLIIHVVQNRQAFYSEQHVASY